MNPLVYFFSDFGVNGPYTGQVEGIIRQRGNANFIDLLSNAPAADPFRSSYLLTALYNHLPVKQDYLFAVVDPGVGSDRGLISFTHEQMTFIGPDNGLLSGIVRYFGITEVSKHKQPAKLASNSFHARDWFAPLIVNMINDQTMLTDSLEARQIVGFDWPDELSEIIYIDHYGNLITGIRASGILNDRVFILSNDQQIRHARTFSSVEAGELFWYENSMGLIEIAANQASAEQITRSSIGDKIIW